MNDENGNSKASNIADVIDAAANLADKVPIYQDAVQPVALETGKALETVGRAVNAALLPIRGVIWGFDQIEEFVKTTVTLKLEKTPAENIQTPDVSIAGPAIQSLQFASQNESLREMYANLLTTSMDSESAKNAHPSFVDIIRNLNSDEARILEFLVNERAQPLVDIGRRRKDRNGITWMFVYQSKLGADAEIVHEDLIGPYLKNLERLGLVDIRKDRVLSRKDAYRRIFDDNEIKSILSDINAVEGFKAEVEKYYVEVSVLGKQFARSCVIGKNET